MREKETVYLRCLVARFLNCREPLKDYRRCLLSPKVGHVVPPACVIQVPGTFLSPALGRHNCSNSAMSLFLDCSHVKELLHLRRLLYGGCTFLLMETSFRWVNAVFTQTAHAIHHICSRTVWGCSIWPETNVRCQHAPSTEVTEPLRWCCIFILMSLISFCVWYAFAIPQICRRSSRCPTQAICRWHVELILFLVSTDLADGWRLCSRPRLDIPLCYVCVPKVVPVTVTSGC